MYCNFTFNTTEWEGIHKFVIFKDGWDNPHHIHLGKDDTFHVQIPNNILEGTNFKVSVYGGDLITTNEVNVILIPSGYTSIFHLPNHEKDKEVFIDIYEKLESKIDDIHIVDGVIKCYSQGKLLFDIPLISELSKVAVTGEYIDLENIPKSFPPSLHNHMVNDITDYRESVDNDLNILLDELGDEIAKE